MEGNMYRVKVNYVRDVPAMDSAQAVRLAAVAVPGDVTSVRMESWQLKAKRAADGAPMNGGEKIDTATRSMADKVATTETADEIPAHV